MGGLALALSILVLPVFQCVVFGLVKSLLSFSGRPVVLSNL
jgi:hypothetical protein